jgi:isopenicillin N synthase-like dioxygenase
MSSHPQPSTLQPYLAETQEFTEFVHKEILYQLLRLFAISLELPYEDFLVDRHRYEVFDESWMRYMTYYDEFSESEAEQIKNVWLFGHADFGSLTLLFSQPMSSLQVRQSDGTWKWVKHIPGAIVVNAGEMMEFWTGGYYKATVHQGTSNSPFSGKIADISVHEPPRDQRNHTRCGVFYFVVPNDDVKINTLLDESPVLRAAGVKRHFEPGKETTSGHYSRARISKVGKTSVHKGGWEGVTEEVVGGVVTKWYT